MVIFKANKIKQRKEKGGQQNSFSLLLEDIFHFYSFGMLAYCEAKQ
jgi:hypothetical protein